MTKAALRLTTLGDLAAVRAELLARSRAAEAAAWAERALRDRDRDRDLDLQGSREPQRGERVDHGERSDSELFRAAVGAVLAITKGVVHAPPRKRPAAIPRQRRLDDASALAESVAGAIDGEALIESDDGLSFHRRGVGADVVRKLRRGVWVLQGELDLHGLNRDAARDRLVAFVADATRTGRRCVRVVHGKGHGSPGREPVLKERVRRWLAQCADVLAYVQARPAEGGAGAIVVLLRAARERPARDAARRA